MLIVTEMMITSTAIIEESLFAVMIMITILTMTIIRLMMGNIVL